MGKPALPADAESIVAATPYLFVITEVAMVRAADVHHSNNAHNCPQLFAAFIFDSVLFLEMNAAPLRFTKGLL